MCTSLLMNNFYCVRFVVTLGDDVLDLKVL